MLSQRLRLRQTSMFALGQKQTYAVHKLMSALPPIATTKADIRKWSCPLYPESGHVRCKVRCLLRAKSGHWRTSLDHLVGAGDERPWDFEAERPCSLEVDGQVELGRTFNW